MSRYLSILASVLLAAVVLSGCPTTPDADVTAPTVTQTSPLDKSEGVAVNAVLTVTFSEAMDSASVTADSIVLKQGDTLIAADVAYADSAATITPKAALGYTTAYTLRVTTSVRDAAGNPIAAAVEAAFTTEQHSGAWDGMKAIENLSTPCDDPVIAASADGTAVCVFTSGTDVYAVRYDGTSWSAPTALNTGVGSCYLPKIAIKPDGGAIAVWMQYDDGGSYFNARASVFTPSTTTWAVPIVLNSDTGATYDCYMPEVAFARDGTEAMVVWIQNNGGGSYLVQSRRYTSSWGSQAPASGGGVHLGTPGIATCENHPVKVVYDAHGYAFAAWVAPWSLWAARCVGGVWGSAVDVSGGSAERLAFITSDSLGGTYACCSQDGASTGAYNSCDGANWKGSISFVSTNSFAYPVIGVSSTGDVFLLSTHLDSGINHLYYNKMPSGASSFIAAVKLDTSTVAADSCSWPSITFDAAENGMAAWLQYNGTTGYYDLWSVRYQGTAFGAPAIIDIGDGPISAKPSLSVGKGNRQFVVWPQNDGTHANIYCRVYTP
jgi:hypothetical protein